MHHGHAPVLLERVHAEPRAASGPLAAGLDHLVEHGLQQVDGHEHVAGQFLAGRERIHHEERAHADQLAVLVDERGAAVVEPRRRGEDRVLDEVFPVAGELAPGNDGRDRDGLLLAAGHDHQAIELRHRRRRSDPDRPRRELPERFHEAESGGVVVRDDGGRNRGAVGIRHLDRVGFHDQVADGEDEAVVANHDARSVALLAERLVAARVGKRLHLDADHRVRRVDERLVGRIDGLGGALGGRSQHRCVRHEGQREGGQRNEGDASESREHGVTSVEMTSG